MRFIYTGGKYTQFMGRVFAFGKSVEVTDRATIEALRKRADFQEVAETPVPVATEPRRPTLTVRRRK